MVDLDGDAHAVVATIHWMGGIHSEVRIARRKRGTNRNHLKPDVVDAVKVLSRVCPDVAIAAYLNRNDIKTGHGNRWTQQTVASCRSKRKLQGFSAKRQADEGWMSKDD